VKNCGLFCAGWWPFLLLPLLLLLAFGLFQWRSVEEDIISNSQQTINQQNQTWAQPETYNRGRDLLVTGAAPSQQARDSLEQDLLSTKGVRVVEFLDGIAEPAPVVATPLRNPSVSIDWVDDMVVLQGEIGSQDTIDSIVANANATYGSQRVINQLRLSDDVGEMAVSANTLNPTAGLSNGAQMSINSGELTLSGEVESEEIKSQIGERVTQAFSGNVINNLTVLINENDLCESRVDELLLSSKIVFATGQANISPESDSLLRSSADLAAECAGANFEVAGHTDSVGNYDSNMQLSQARAQAVVDRLIELQLDGERFTVSGYGPDQPIADNESAEGRAQNRRIEFNLRN